MRGREALWTGSSLGLLGRNQEILWRLRGPGPLGRGPSPGDRLWRFLGARKGQGERFRDLGVPWTGFFVGDRRGETCQVWPVGPLSLGMMIPPPPPFLYYLFHLNLAL